MVVYKLEVKWMNQASTSYMISFVRMGDGAMGELYLAQIGAAPFLSLNPSFWASFVKSLSSSW